MITKFLAGVVGGFIFALFGFMNVAIITESPQLRLMGFFGCWVAAVTIAVRSPEAPKAWQNLLFSTGLLLFLLPMLGGIRITLDFMDKAESGAAGLLYFAVVVGMLVVLAGGVFWAVGSFLGRDKRG